MAVQMSRPWIRSGRLEAGRSRILRYMASRLLKKALPARPVPTRVLRGPFRGAVMVVDRRHSIRKILGLYEHELNTWLVNAIPRVTRVLDVGANDGYFTFGCAAAFRRHGRNGQIIAFEPQADHVHSLRESIAIQPAHTTQISVRRCLVGSRITPGMTTLDSVSWQSGDCNARGNTLIKIDVEGAELEVLSGALSWLSSSNLFVIEVHEMTSLQRIAQLFSAHSLALDRIDQRPLPFLGREQRQQENWWLVSALNQRS